MLNPKELRFECTRCGNCCTDSNTLVNLTYLDILRIIRGLKLNINELLSVIGFYIFNKRLNKNTLEKMVVSPIETKRGLAFIALLKNPSGECYFYDKKDLKCSIYSIRPMFCRTFPFTFSITKQKDSKVNGNLEIYFAEKAKNYCPGITKDSPIIEYNFWDQIGHKTLKELEKNLLFNKSWNKKVKNKELLAGVKNYLNLILKMSE